LRTIASHQRTEQVRLCSIFAPRLWVFLSSLQPEFFNNLLDKAVLPCQYVSSSRLSVERSSAHGVRIAAFSYRINIKELSRYLGHVTNSVAEYEGLVMGLEALLQMGAKKNKFRAIPNCRCANSVTNTG
jgi:hypothetical protein